MARVILINPHHKGDLALLPSFRTVWNLNNETKTQTQTRNCAPRFRDVSTESLVALSKSKCYSSFPFDRNCTLDTPRPGGICISRFEGLESTLSGSNGRAGRRERGVEELKWNENASIWSADVWSTDEWAKLTSCTNDVNTVLHDRRLVNNSGEKERERERENDQ